MKAYILCVINLITRSKKIYRIRRDLKNCGTMHYLGGDGEDVDVALVVAEDDLVLVNTPGPRHTDHALGRVVERLDREHVLKIHVSTFIHMSSW